MIYGTSTSSFPDDGYGWSTDNPPTAYEHIDHALSPKDEEQIKEAFRDFRETLAHEFFNCGRWDAEWWDAWEQKVNDLI